MLLFNCIKVDNQDKFWGALRDQMIRPVFYQGIVDEIGYVQANTRFQLGWKDPFDFFRFDLQATKSVRFPYKNDWSTSISKVDTAGKVGIWNGKELTSISYNTHNSYTLLALAEKLSRLAIVQPVEVNQWSKSWASSLFEEMVNNLGFELDDKTISYSKSNQFIDTEKSCCIAVNNGKGKRDLILVIKDVNKIKDNLIIRFRMYQEPKIRVEIALKGRKRKTFGAVTTVILDGTGWWRTLGSGIVK